MRFLLNALVSCSMLILSFTLHASPVMKITLQGDSQNHYDEVSQSLEKHRFFIIMEPNIGRSISNYKERWGEDYNRNGYEEIRSLVFCNPWYVNQVINKDPEMAALCPLSVSLLHKGGTTEVLLLRPSQLKPNSPAQAILEELEADIVKALNEASQ